MILGAFPGVEKSGNFKRNNSTVFIYSPPLAKPVSANGKRAQASGDFAANNRSNV